MTNVASTTSVEIAESSAFGNSGKAAAGPSFDWRPQLDGIRGLAVLGVVTFHTWPQIARDGGLGVTVFFVLSGFLITRLLLKEHEAVGRISLGRFYMRRALRLLPALGLVLLFCLLMSLTVLPATVARATETGILTSALYVSDIYTASQGWISLGLLGHTWSLSAEEQFYAAWPVVLIALMRWGRARRIVYVATVCAVAFAIIQATLSFRGAQSWTVSPLTAGGIFVGCAVGAADSMGWLRWISPTALRLTSVLGGLLLVGEAVIGDASIRFGGAELPLQLCAAAVVLAASRSLLVPLAWGPLVTIGRISYGIYLWHYPLTGMQGSASGPLSFVGVTAATLLVAWLSYRYLERPALRLQRIFRARHSNAIAGC
jgi:peptidoglycan/LPS O-acetylase OafA/YrhL